MKKSLLSILILFITINLLAQNPPKRELRGVWISTHLSLDWPNRLQTPFQQQAAFVGILDHNKTTGMNAAYLQVRSQADAMYASNLEPWSYYLTNNQGTAPSPFWDPLQFAVDESHKRGLELHAWINPYRAVANTANANIAAQYSTTHVSKTHPEWLLTIGTVQILNPGLEVVRNHITNVVVDIVKRYDIDGIHFDDYFYPTGTINDDAAYNADPRGFPATTAGRADWRRDNIDLLIKRVYDSINVLKPWVKFGVSPSGIYRSSTDPVIGSPTLSGAYQHYSQAFADSKKWISQGWVDYLAPQVYWYSGQTGSDYKLLVPWWNNNAFGRHIYIGLADYKVGTTGWTSASEIPNQIRLNRLYPNVYGQIHFRHAFLVANTLKYRDSLRYRVYNKPALVPTMPWKDDIAPAKAEDLSLTKNADNTMKLSWTKPAVTSNEFDNVKRFVIYRSLNKYIDLEDVDNILSVTNTDINTYTDNTLNPDSTYFYSVTALDRLHNESNMSNIVSNDNIKPIVITQNISRTLINGSVNITANDINNGSYDNWGIDSMYLNKTSFSCSDIGENSVTLIAIDKAGNIDSASATVTIIGSVPLPVISISRLDNTFTGLPDNTIALGYGAQSLTLTASTNISGGEIIDYSWSPENGLSNTNTGSTEFTPTAAGTYNFTVTATNEFGCSASASVTINVIDVRCGNNKVLVSKEQGKNAHSSNQLCISINAVPAHLQNGETLGNSTNENITTIGNNNASVQETALLNAYPNPFKSQTTISFTLAKAEKQVILELSDLSGYRLLRVYKVDAEANKVYNIMVDASNFNGKLFNVRLITRSKVYNFRLIKE